MSQLRVCTVYLQFEGQIMSKKSPSFSLHVKISHRTIKVMKCSAADTFKSLVFNCGQGYKTKKNLKSGKYGNVLTEV